VQQDVRHRLVKEADTILAPLGVYVVDMEVESGRNRTLVRFFVDVEEGKVDISHCAKASRTLIEHYDTHLTFGENYAIEVSSPGMERRIARPRDFKRFAGSEAQVRLSKVVDGRRNFRAILGDSDDNNFTLLLGEEKLTLPFTFLSRANLVYDFTKHKEDADGIQS